MEHHKIRSIENRPNDYLKERNCRSTIQNRRSYGTSLIGWEALRLKENVNHSRANSSTLKFLDNMRHNNFCFLSEKCTKMIDKQLLMKRGFPFHKLDMRRQRNLVKEADNLTKNLNISKMQSKNTPKNSENMKNKRISQNQTKLKKNSNYFSSIQHPSYRNSNDKYRIKASTRLLYDRIYEEKLKAHFSVPYPKFPYNLDKDTIFINEKNSCKLESLLI